MDRHFRIAGGSRGEENPFRPAVLASIMRSANRFRTATCEAFDARKVGRAISLVAYDRIDFCSRDDVRKTIPRQIARTENHPARDTVQFDQRQSGSELIMRRDQDRASTQIVEAAGETRASRQIPQRYALLATDERAALERFFSAEQGASPCAVLVDTHEVFEGYRKLDFLVGGERVKPEFVFQTRHDYGEAERVEAGVEQHQVVRQRRQMLILLFGD